MSFRGKRKYSGRRGHGQKSHPPSREAAEVDESNPIIQAFRSYQLGLDDRHDRHERIVKLSRDITIESKRMIFLLHRISGDQNRESILSEAEEKLKEIQQDRWKILAKELQGQDPYQYLRAYSPGLQEYIEAQSFYHYQKYKTLLSLQEVEKPLHFTLEPGTVTTQDETTTPTDTAPESSPTEAEPPPPQEPVVVSIHVPPLEYILGLADLTGELMRMAINSVGAGQTEAAFALCAFMRIIHKSIMTCSSGTRELWRKINVLQASIKKVETACYTVQVRGSEIPKHMLTEALLAVPAEQMIGAGESLEDH